MPRTLDAGPLDVEVDLGTVDDAGKMPRATVRGEAPASHRTAYVACLAVVTLRNSRRVLLDNAFDASVSNEMGLPPFTDRRDTTYHDTNYCGRKRRKGMRHLAVGVSSFLVEIPKCKISLADTPNNLAGYKGLKGQRSREACNGERGNESCEHYRSPYPSYRNSRRFGTGRPIEIVKRVACLSLLRFSRLESVCEGRKQVYNPAGIMQIAGKRSADCRITLPGRPNRRSSVFDRKRKGENGVYFSTNLTGTRPYFRLP
ncbi:hypothetical protein G5I_06554 [Acromyrmex echinatior]|uniref:Uncharacterized protein n=1 Tax=Acromyrmex echinatior TaxID=103372 RepID=F4WLC9_ACREC|nr:hypothetical protein G5I_06554 [Acromyrmex echinatior]